MNIKLNSLLVATTVIVGMTIGAWGQASGAQAPQSKAAMSQKNITALMVLSAGVGVIAKTGDGYRLTLKDVDSHTLWFEDRPGRRSGFIKTARFIKLWPKVFKKSAPNAGLTHGSLRVKRNGKSEPEALELTKPSWNKKGALVFKVKTLEGDKVQAGSFNDAVLLIDDSCLNLGNGIVACSGGI